MEADVGRVAQMAGLDPISGTSFAGLARAAAELGLEARCYRLRLKDLRRVTARTPGIAHVGGDHFVVVWTSGRNEVAILRPPLVSRHARLRNFGRRWNGALLVVSRPGEQPAWRPHYLRWAPALAAVMLFGAAWGAFRRRRARPRLPKGNR